jgi:hypothetical protein
VIFPAPKTAESQRTLRLRRGLKLINYAHKRKGAPTKYL